jgi:hypothetical protein
MATDTLVSERERLYKAFPAKPEIVHVPEMSFVMIDGHGDPNMCRGDRPTTAPDEAFEQLTARDLHACRSGCIREARVIVADRSEILSKGEDRARWMASIVRSSGGWRAAARGTTWSSSSTSAIRDMSVPRPDPLPRPADGARVRRHDVLGDLIHEHDLAPCSKVCVPFRLQHRIVGYALGALVVLLLTVGCGRRS